jgi:hypothetical protein
VDSHSIGLTIIFRFICVSSGISKAIPGYGAAIVFVGDNAIIDKFAYRTINDNLLEITVLFDDDKAHDVVFLIVNEKLPS